MGLLLNSFDGKPRVKMDSVQLEALRKFKEKVKSGEYSFVDNPCLCGNGSYKTDWVLTEQDRFGIEMKNVICESCGLIRPINFLDENSVIAFYTHEYRSLYGGADKPKEEFFAFQQKLGGEYLALFLKSAKITDKNLKVFEIGCGAGGIIKPFQNYGFEVAGCDFNENYLKYGNEHGLNLKFGDYRNILDDESADVIVLSQVFEHFLHPLKEMSDMLVKIKPGGHLVFSVPGILDVHREYIDPILYFQNAHVFCFYEAFLREMFSQFGCEVVHGDETCIFIVRKPIGWKPITLEKVNSDKLKDYPKYIRNYMIKTETAFRYKTSTHYWKRKYGKRIGAMLDKVGLKEVIKKLGA